MYIITHDNCDVKLNDIRKAKSIEEIEILAKKLGLVVSVTENYDWIALANTLKGEDIFMASKIKTVTYKGKEYPVRDLTVMCEGQKREYRISVESLFIAYGNAYDNEGTKAFELDNEIYYYVEDELIGIDAVEICEKWLDIPMEYEDEFFT